MFPISLTLLSARVGVFGRRRIGLLEVVLGRYSIVTLFVAADPILR
jgi:hypothetical protein